MGGSWRWGLILGMVCMVLGMGLSQQLRLVSQLNNTTRVQQGRILTFLVTRTVEQNQSLRNQIANLLNRVNNLPSPMVTPMAEKLAVIRRMAGLTSVEGPGVEVILHDAVKPSYPGEPSVYQLVHDQYVLHVVALLSAAGATAISIDGQRYVSTTSIFCAGPTIRINGINYGAPYVVLAVGAPQALLTALADDPDVQGWSQLVSISYRAENRLKVVGYRGQVQFNNARPAKI